MPIYEFRCLDCDEITEVLFTSSDDSREIRCGACGGSDLHRVISTSNFTMGSSSERPTAKANSKTCATGSCSTLEIPGLGD